MGLKRIWTGIQKKRMGLWIAVAAAILSVSACVPIKTPKEPLPEDTLEAFEDAVNANDINAMMEYLDEKTNKSITASMNLAMGIFGAVTDIDLGISAEDILEAAPLLQEFFPVDAPAVDFQATHTYISGKRATVYYNEAVSGETSAVNMVKEDGQWKVSLDKRYIDEADAERVIVAGQEESGETDGKNQRDAEELIGDLAEFFGFD